MNLSVEYFKMCLCSDDVLKNITFQHQSPHDLVEIVPQSYDFLYRDRADDLGKAGSLKYVKERIIGESDYKKKLGIKSKSSFVYATVVGFNQMENVFDYPGFTYYFKLSEEQMSKSLFGIVNNGDIVFGPEAGVKALRECVSEWLKIKKVVIFDDKIIGRIVPRIEVIIPFTVKSFAKIPEIEQRI